MVHLTATDRLVAKRARLGTYPTVIAEAIPGRATDASEIVG